MRRFATVLKSGAVTTRGRVQNCQCLVLRDALMIFSPISLPPRSDKISETRKRKKNKYEICSPLKMMASFGHQKFPKHCVC